MQSIVNSIYLGWLVLALFAVFLTFVKPRVLQWRKDRFYKRLRLARRMSANWRT